MPNRKNIACSFVGARMILRGKIVYYIKYYDLMEILFSKDTNPTSKRKYDYIMTSDMIIIDELLCTGISSDEFTTLFRFISTINGVASIVAVTNRYFDEWLDASGDEFLMQTLIERLLGDCEIFKTQVVQNDLLTTRCPKKKLKKPYKR